MSSKRIKTELHAVSPVKVEKHFVGDAFVRKKSSQVHSIMPNNPETYVKVLRHLWNKCNRSPRKRKFLKELWPCDKQLNKDMFDLGKYKVKRNKSELQKTVDKIKKRYKSLRQAWQHTSMHWNEFHRATRLEESKPTIRKTSVHKLNS